MIDEKYSPLYFWRLKKRKTYAKKNNKNYPEKRVRFY
jgi:hypothetical protein